MLKDIGPHAGRLHPLIPTFSVRNAIIEQVQKEDFIKWAMAPDSEFVPVVPIEATSPMRRTPLAAFLRDVGGILP